MQRMEGSYWSICQMRRACRSVLRAPAEAAPKHSSQASTCARFMFHSELQFGLRRGALATSQLRQHTHTSPEKYGTATQARAHLPKHFRTLRMVAREATQCAFELLPPCQHCFWKCFLLTNPRAASFTVQRLTLSSTSLLLRPASRLASRSQWKLEGVCFPPGMLRAVS